MEESLEYPDLAVALLLDETELRQLGQVPLDARIVEAGAAADLAYVELAALGEDLKGPYPAAAAEEFLGSGLTS